jgi:hypothetical protein
MRRRYRSEEIQQIFFKKKSSLRFDSKHKKFISITEQKHQIYRILSQTVDKYNTKLNIRIKVKRWLTGLVGELIRGCIAPRRARVAVKKILDKRSMKSKVIIDNYKRYNLSLSLSVSLSVAVALCLSLCLSLPLSLCMLRF